MSTEDAPLHPDGYRRKWWLLDRFSYQVKEIEAEYDYLPREAPYNRHRWRRVHGKRVDYSPVIGSLHETQDDAYAEGVKRIQSERRSLDRSLKRLLERKAAAETKGAQDE